MTALGTEDNVTATTKFSNPVVRWIDYRRPLFHVSASGAACIPRTKDSKPSLEFWIAGRNRARDHDRDLYRSCDELLRTRLCNRAGLPDQRSQARRARCYEFDDPA